MQTRMNTTPPRFTIAKPTVQLMPLSQEMVNQGQGVKRRREGSEVRPGTAGTSSAAARASKVHEETAKATPSTPVTRKMASASTSNGNATTISAEGTQLARMSAVRATNMGDYPLPPDGVMRKMLEDKVETDWTIVSSDGKDFACHKSVLAVQVPHFRHLFGVKDSWEVANKRIRMTSEMAMCEDSVLAFLRYIYFRDTTGVKNNPKVICSMIRIGCYCSLSALTEMAVEFLLQVEDHLSFKTCLNDLANIQQITRRWANDSPLKGTLNNRIIQIVRAIFGIDVPAASNSPENSSDSNSN